MAAEENLRSKILYRSEIGLLRILPMLLAFIYVLNTILSYFNIDILLPSILGGMSLLPLLFLYVSSYAFKFCSYHRMFLHYIVIVDVLNYIDYYVVLPLSNRELVSLHLVLYCFFLFLTLYLKFRVCKH